jgi:hypothetical protein
MFPVKVGFLHQCRERDVKNGRSDRNRTCDVLLPKQVLYQAELRSEPLQNQ